MKEITIHLEGGMIQSVSCKDEIFRITVHDFDINPSDDEGALPDSRGKYFVKICFLSTLTDKDAPHPKS